MKKVFWTFLLFIGLLIFSSSHGAFSQSPAAPTMAESDFDKAYAAYLQSVDEYNDVHNEYVLRRSQYLNFKTLKSQQDAHDATVRMLKARDKVVIMYLTALKEKLEEAIGVQSARKEGLIIRIDEEISWFNTHSQEVSGAGSLEDLVADSNEAEKQFSFIEPLFYEILSVVAQGKLNDFTERTDELVEAVDSKLEVIRNEDREGFSFSSEKFAVLDRWMFEARNRVARSKEKQITADAAIADYARKKGGAILSNYNSVSSTLGESQLFLKEANTFLKEIIREIKTAEE